MFFSIFKKTRNIIKKTISFLIGRSTMPKDQKEKELKEPSLSDRLEKLDEEMDYPEISIDNKKLNDIWNDIVD